VLEFPAFPTLTLAKLLTASSARASGEGPWRDGNTAHVLLLLAEALPRVASAVAATGVALDDLRAAADAAAVDYRLTYESGNGLWEPPDFVRAALADDRCVLGRLARAYGWTHRDVEAICDAAGGMLPMTLPGMIDGSG
jgi:hypothetical protein